MPVLHFLSISFFNSCLISAHSCFFVFFRQPLILLTAPDVEFIATDPASWMDTDNWCSTATELGACDKTYRLDVEQVPCKYDDVVFARNHGYFVDLSNNVPNMAIKSLKISGSVSNFFF